MAVREHARAMQLEAPSFPSLSAFIAMTKRSRNTIENVIERLGIKLRRSVRIDPRQQRHPNMFIVLPEQQTAILEYLKQLPDGRVYGSRGERTVRGVWGIGNKPPCCYECGTSERPHFARGFCQRCYTWIIKSRSKEKNPWTSSKDSRTSSPS